MKKRFTEEQIVGAIKRLEGGMEVADAKRLRALEAENAKLKRMVADQALMISDLKWVNLKNW